jgi:hypothetical protein
MLKQTSKTGFMITMLLLASACGKKDAPVPAPALNRMSAKDSVRTVSELKHKRVRELFVVLFEKNFTPDEWKTIFDQTRILSANKKTIRTIEGMDDEASSEIRGKLITENADLLTSLAGKSLFMMNWSIQDENCKLSLKDFWQLVCKPRNPNNPLNGGLPHGVGAVEWITPDPVTSITKIPYLRMVLKKDVDSTTSSPLAYEMELRLKEERFTESESWFKGEALPTMDSIFVRPDGTVASQVFPYGYVELTLGN